MKFMVMVNRKYLVMVEAQTAGGAEHVILDNVYYGVETCQAFSLKEMATEFFRSCAEECETVSYEELMEKGKAYKNALDSKKKYEALVKEYEKTVRELSAKIELEKSNIQITLDNIESCERELKQIW